MFILEKRHHYARESGWAEVAEGFNRTSRTKLHRTRTQGRKHRLSSRMSTEDFLNKMPGSVGGKVWNCRASSPVGGILIAVWAGEKVFNLVRTSPLALLNDIQ